MWLRYFVIIVGIYLRNALLFLNLEEMLAFYWINESHFRTKVAFLVIYLSRNHSAGLAD